MKITEAKQLIEKLKEQSNKKSFIKHCDNFLQIFDRLAGRSLSDDEISKVEFQLGQIDWQTLQPNKSRKLQAALSNFKKFLEKELGLVTKGYYQETYMTYGLIFGVSIGTSLGVSFGAAFQSIAMGTSFGPSMGLSIGMVIGMLIGNQKDKEAEAVGSVL